MLTLNDLQSAFGISVVMLVITQLVKDLLPEAWIPRFAVLCGIVVAVVVGVILGARTAETIGNAVLTGFLGGAASVGYYQLQKPASILPPKG